MKCHRCKKWIGVFGLLQDDGEYEQVCAQCLTPVERAAIDAGRNQRPESNTENED